jgi:hypothetical protein
LDHNSTVMAPLTGTVIAGKTKKVPGYAESHQVSCRKKVYLISYYK